MSNVGALSSGGTGAVIGARLVSAWLTLVPSLQEGWAEHWVLSFPLGGG